MAIPFSQAGETKLDHASGTSLSPRRPHSSDDASPQPPIPSPPPCEPSAAIVINPRKQKCVSVLARKQKQVSVSAGTQERSCNSTVKHHRHSLPRRRVTFTLPSHHVDKDSTIWRRVHPEECTTDRIDPLVADRNRFQFPPPPTAAHVPSPSLTPLPGHPHHPVLQVLPSTHEALICPALEPWLVFIMPVLAFQSNKSGWMPSKQATATPSRASLTPMLPSIVWTQTK